MDDLETIARRHDVSVAAVRHLLDALTRGRGGMAQFDHPDLGGSGQWMKGGMTMVGNMFDHRAKAKVDALCSELADLVPAEAASHQPWWKADLGIPGSSGAQNDVRYAYFPATRRLAFEKGGRVTVYDTLDHEIRGFSQQQSGGSSVTFSSQHGAIDLAQLPVIGAEKPAPARGSAPPAVPASPRAAVPEAVASSKGDDPLATIERIAALRDKGILTEEEFTAKKRELLARL